MEGEEKEDLLVIPKSLQAEVLVLPLPLCPIGIPPGDAKDHGKNFQVHVLVQDVKGH